MNSAEQKQQTMAAPMPGNRLLTTKQAADYWGISRWTIYDLVAAGKLKPVIGINSKWRWKAGDLDAANVMQRL